MRVMEVHLCGEDWLTHHWCHRSAYPVPFPITVHALTWFHSSLIEHTCNHLPSPFISSLTSVTHRLILRLQGCMVAAHYTGHCLPVCPSILDLVPAWGYKAARLQLSTLVKVLLSACLSWNSSLPVETQVYKQLILFILLPEHSSLSLLCWKPCLGYS